LVKNIKYELYQPLEKPVQNAATTLLISGKFKPEAAMRAPHYSSDAQNVNIHSENTHDTDHSFNNGERSGWEEPKAKKDSS
jgi:hypothetical protein